MKLFRVYNNSGIKAFLVSNTSGKQTLGGAQFGPIQSGNHLLNTSMIVQMGEGKLKFMNGPETVEAGASAGAHPNPQVEALLKGLD